MPPKRSPWEKPSENSVKARIDKEGPDSVIAHAHGTLQDVNMQHEARASSAQQKAAAGGPSQAAPTPRNANTKTASTMHSETQRAMPSEALRPEGWQEGGSGAEKGQPSSSAMRAASFTDARFREMMLKPEERKLSFSRSEALKPGKQPKSRSAKD